MTLQLEDVPLETAVRLMCEMVGLKPVRVGNVMFICSKAAAADLKTDPDLVPPSPVPGFPGGPPPPGINLPGTPIAPPLATPPVKDPLVPPAPKPETEKPVPPPER